jgi:hypothetical protein
MRAAFQRDVESRQRESNIEGMPDPIADDETRPGIENAGDVDEARRAMYVMFPTHSRLEGRSESDPSPGREDRPVMIGIRRRDVSPAMPRLPIVVAHETPQFLWLTISPCSRNAAPTRRYP